MKCQALLKLFKYKFIVGGNNANRPLMFVDGDESFTKTGTYYIEFAGINGTQDADADFALCRGVHAGCAVSVRAVRPVRGAGHPASITIL